MGYLRWVLGVALRDKGHRSEICKASMSSHFPEWLDPSYVNSAMRPKCPRKEWRTKSFRLQSTPMGKWPKVCPRTKWRDYVSNLACSHLGVEPAELSDISVDREIIWVLLGLLPPRLSPKAKLAWKLVNEWLCKPTLNLYVYEIVVSLFAQSEWRIRFCENPLKVSKIEGKMVLTP